jgi:hypothetical protein
MTSTNKGSQVGGHRTEVDQQKLGPTLVITAACDWHAPIFRTPMILLTEPPP